MLHITLLKLSALILLPFMLAGCGLTQKISDGASSAVKSVFYRQVKTLRLDFSARNALNTDNREDNSASQPVMVRVYVLKDRKTFDKTVYQQLAAEGEDIEVLEWPLARALRAIREGEIVDAKTIMLLQHLALNADTLLAG